MRGWTDKTRQYRTKNESSHYELHLLDLDEHVVTEWRWFKATLDKLTSALKYSDS